MAAQTAAEHPVGSIEGILAMGRCYLKYARDKRIFFSLMWESRGDIDQRREKAQTDHGGFEILVNLVSAFCQARGRPEVNASQLATSLWSLSHGIATLEANQLLDLFDRTVTAESYSTTADEGFCTAFSHHDRGNPTRSWRFSRARQTACATIRWQWAPIITGNRKRL